MADLETFDTPLYDPSPALFAGTSSSNLVPYPFPVGLGGHYYGVQWDKDSIGIWGAKFKRESLPLLRQQADNSNIPGEQSISPEQFWRRSQDTWLYGEGQTYLDRSTSEIRRYHDGLGIDPWTPWQLKLLNDTTKVYASTNTGLQCVTAGIYIYLLDGSAIKYSSGTLATWLTATGATGSPVSIDTDGNTIYTAHGSNGIYSGTVGGTTVSSFATGTATLVRFTKSRLMVAGGGKLYNVTTTGALPTALLDLSSRNFTWVDICGGQSQIYAAGYAGDKSLIYRTGILPDGTALAVPTVAAELPDGEIVRSISAYLGYIMIGSDKGVRFCSVNTDGSLTIGGIISTDSPVYCFEAQDHFVWYGESNYNAYTSGLGRMDLTTFTSNLVPAYAADIMSFDTSAGKRIGVLGTVRSVITFNNKRYFTVDGFGLVGEASVPVPDGTFISGVIAYGISDPKVAMYVDIKHEPLQGSIEVGIVADQNDAYIVASDANIIGTSNVQGSVSGPYPFPAGQLSGENFQIVIKLISDGTHSPILTRWILRSYPKPVRSAQWDVPLLIYPTVTLGDKDWAQDSDAELQFLYDLHKNQNIVSLQVADNVYQVIMYDYQWLPDAVDIYGKVRGVFYAQLREIVG